MRVPFLFAIAFCAITYGHAVQMTDLIPQEEKVLVQSLPNGVKTYIQENDQPAGLGSFKVVLRTVLCDEVLFAYDGKMDSPEQIEHFFEYCKERAEKEVLEEGKINFHAHLSVFRTGIPQQMAVIAVGDFSKEEMQRLIEKHFGTIALTQSDEPSHIQVGCNAALNKVAMRVSFPNLHSSIQSYHDLKECWKLLMLQELYQQRLERCSRKLQEAYIHPHPRFFYPVNGYTFSSEEVSENLLSYLFWQVESIRNEGFSEEEFYWSKRMLLNQLHYLASSAALPDHAFLTSYYADQFLLGDRCPSHEPFLAASIQLVEEIKSDDLLPHIDSFLAEKNRSVRVVYPKLTLAQGLTKEQIEKMITRIGSLASFYHGSEISEDEFWTLDAKNQASSAPKATKTLKPRKGSERSSPSFLVAKEDEPAQPSRFAGNAPVVQIAYTPGPTEHFYQLPLNDKEKRIINTIISTMAEKNIIQLALEKRTMEKKGKKVHHVHPMRFIGHIFSTPELKKGMGKIVKSSFKWDAFVDGFSKRMKEEHSYNNLHRHIPGFCQEVGANPDEVAKFIDKRDWEGLVKSLI
jgi:hypothetical protein